LHEADVSFSHIQTLRIEARSVDGIKQKNADLEKVVADLRQQLVVSIQPQDARHDVENVCCW
jgi:uncharacterized protein YlxP (DUF503 family)